MGSRTVIAATAAVIALGIGSWAALRVGPASSGATATRPSPPLQPLTSPEATTSAPRPAPAPVPAPTADAGGPAVPSRAADAPPGGAKAPAAAAWEEVPFTERPEDLGGALARAVADGVVELREQLTLCFAVEPDAPRGPAGPEGDPEPPALELRLEARGDEVVVADALVDTYGPSISLVTCARERVKGFRFPASEPAGRRIRLGFPLQ